MGKQEDQRENKGSKRTKKLRYTIIAISAFLLGAAVASAIWYVQLNNTIGQLASEIKPSRQADNSYQFIDPLLGYSLPTTIQGFDEYSPLRTAVQNAIGQASSSVTNVGVYFRDLSLGRWMGINENETFAPGSLMKVVIMMAYFNEAEDNPNVLQQTLTYSSAVADQLNGIPFETPSNLQVGNAYTVEQLIEAMIISSDNGAKNVLLDNINQNSLDAIYTDLGLPAVNENQNYNTYAISPKQYSVLLRILFNADYLSRSYSEQALEIMSRAEYQNGLIAGLPQGTSVAQKFGESVSGTITSPTISLSNCGIVYYPQHPYVLCVMTTGSDPNALAQAIAAVSKTVWQGVGQYVSSGQ